MNDPLVLMENVETPESIWMEEYSNLASSGWEKIFSYFETKIFSNETIDPIINLMQRICFVEDDK